MTGLSVLLLLGTLAVWAKGYWQGGSFMLFSEEVSAEGWLMRWWDFESGGGDVGVARVWFYADTAQARARGRFPGTRREWGVYNRDTGSVGRSYAWYGGDVRRANTRPLYWDHAGIVFARLEGRGTRGGLWAGVVDDVWVRIDRFAFPCWMPAVLFALLPDERV